MFSDLVKCLALPGFEDTQCGFKCFRAEAADDLFQVQLFDGMSFDVEVLYIARQRGYRIVEVPIDWYYRSESRVQPLADPLRMLADILTHPAQLAGRPLHAGPNPSGPAAGQSLSPGRRAARRPRRFPGIIARAAAVAAGLAAWWPALTRSAAAPGPARWWPPP